MCVARLRGMTSTAAFVADASTEVSVAAPRRRPARARGRFSAIGASLALHAVVIAAGAWIQSGAARLAAAADRPEDARYEAFVVERAVAADEVVAPAPEFEPRVAASTARGGDDPVPALVEEEADDLPPPCAAPTIAVDGGSKGRARPTEWSSRPTLARSAYFGRGHGGRKKGGTGAGGRSGPVAEQAMVVAAPAPPTPPPRPVVRVEARLVSYSSPEYPERARDLGLEGAVRVEVEILADATVGRVRVVQSSGVAAFDEAAVEAVRAWRFAAATLDGVAFASTIALPPIRFRLE
jgi:protein TonB